MKTRIHFKEQSWNLDEVGLISKLESAGLPSDFTEFLYEWLSDQKTFDISTSGTTGAPKVMTVRREDLIHSAGATIRYLGIQPGASLLHCLPCKYIAGKMMLIRGLVHGMNIHVVEPAANPLLQVKDQIDFIAITPHQLSYILKDVESSEKLKRIAKVIVGGGPISGHDVKTLENFPNDIYHTYGMTETLSHIAMQKLSGPGLHRIFAIIDDGFKISTDERQCLVIQTPYAHQQNVVTNDVVELLNEREFKWLGRSDDMINSGGIKIHPATLEDKLRPHIKETFFIAGIPDEHLGERTTLFIEDDVYSREKLKALSDIVSRVLPDDKVRPKKVGFVKEFLRTETEKVRRKETIGLMRDLVDL